jgi:hypothetical protein
MAVMSGSCAGVVPPPPPPPALDELELLDVLAPLFARVPEQLTTTSKDNAAGASFMARPPRGRVFVTSAYASGAVS